MQVRISSKNSRCSENTPAAIPGRFGNLKWAAVIIGKVGRPGPVVNQGRGMALGNIGIHNLCGPDAILFVRKDGRTVPGPVTYGRSAGHWVDIHGYSAGTGM